MASGSEATFLFADIAGFTALTEVIGDEQAVQLVDDFAAAVRAEVSKVGGEYVKTIGDAVMMRVPDPGDAIRLGLWITRSAMSGHQAPSVRVGGNYGTAVERGGDYFGTTINIAARVSGLARGGELLVTGHTAELAPDLDGILYESRGRQELRNIAEPVEIFAVTRVNEDAARLVVDPVCRMAVDPERAVGRVVYEGSTYHLCSMGCVAAFSQNPQRYAS